MENQIGRTYFGDIGNFWDRNSDTQNGVGSDSWQYHQYDPAVMEALAKFIDAAVTRSSSYAYIDKSSPVGISRHLTDVLSATTRRRINGLLIGKWPGADEEDPYSDGKEPGYWTGSRKIYTLWNSDGESVRYVLAHRTSQEALECTLKYEH